jgi:hypothetical protein
MVKPGKKIALLQKKGFIATPPFFMGGSILSHALQMLPKRAATINPFVGAAGVISRPYKWLNSTNRICRDGSI